MKLEHENKYNILLVGSGIAGKTSYINSYLTKEFTDNILSTIGINPLTSLGEGSSVFTSPYLSAGALHLAKPKG